MTFEPPKSVRQIGESGENPKIYVEDYVISFAKQLAKEAGDKAVAGVLLGKSYVRRGDKYIKISGMVAVNGINELDGHTFTHEMWTDIYTQIKEHFSDVEIMGWYYAKSEMPLVCSENLTKIHQQNFAGGDKILYLYEEAEREDTFFVPEQGDMRRQNGYFIYYEKNPQMQEYMLLHQPHVPEEVPDEAVQKIHTILEKKQEEKKQAKRHYGLGTVAAMLALILCFAAMGNQALLQKQVASLKNRIAQTKQQVKQAEVETLAGKVQPVSKSAVTVEIVSQAAVATSKPASKPTLKPTPKPASAVKPAGKTQNKNEQKSGKKASYYIVKEGDTLSQIAQKMFSNIAYAVKIQRLNGLSSADNLKIGQKLKLPTK